MIVETIQHLMTPCPRPLKRLGVLRGLIALQHRARRCATAWAPHLAQARAAALAGADAAQAAGSGRGLAVVCGSGLLLDVPLADLAARFDRVVLIDLVHMPAVRRAVASFGNVELVTHDLGGVMAGLEDALAGGTLPAPNATVPHAGEADFVLSANCLSQIPLDPMTAAWARKTVDPAAVAAWGQKLIAAHLAALKDCAGTVTLVTDIERRATHAHSGDVGEIEDLLLEVPLPDMTDRRDWWWRLAPAPEARRRWHIDHRVNAGILAPHRSNTQN